MFSSIDWIWWIQMYFSGQFASLMLLLSIALYDHKKNVPLLFMVILTILWPIAFPLFIALAFTRFNRPPNVK